MSPHLLARALRGGLFALFLLSCSSSSSTSSSASSSSSSGAPSPFPTQQKPAQLFSKAITDVIVEVDYVPGAEPFVGAQGGKNGLADVWQLMNNNTRAIFETKKVTVPATLAQMEKLDAEAPQPSYADKDILALATAHRDQVPDGAVASFYVIFLPGNYVDETGAVDEDRLGVAIADTGVIAMFKPAINKPAGAQIPPPAYVEQLAMIHEMGHAVGFVDNGVPVGSNNLAHVDTATPHHCTNKQCAMFAGIDTVQGAAPYAMSLIRYQTSVLIGQECLSDARIFANTL